MEADGEITEDGSQNQASAVLTAIALALSSLTDPDESKLKALHRLPSLLLGVDAISLSTVGEIARRPKILKHLMILAYMLERTDSNLTLLNAALQSQAFPSPTSQSYGSLSNGVRKRWHPSIPPGA